MADVATLAVALVAQDQGFTHTMTAGTDVVKGFERSHLSLKSVMESIQTPTERYEHQVEQLNKWQEIGKLTAHQYAEALEKARESMEKASGHGALRENLGEGLTDLAAELLPAISAAEMIDKAVEGIKHGFEEVGQIGRSAIRLGVSAEEFSRLKYAAEVTHVPVEALEADFGKMLNSIEKAAEGSKNLVPVFDRLHLNIEQLKEAEPAEAFERIGEAIAHVANRAERMNDVREIFGRAGTAILPMIENLHSLEAESDNVGFTRTTAEIEKVEEAEKEAARAAKQMEAAFMDFGAHVAPVIAPIAKYIAGAVEGARTLEGRNLLLTVATAGIVPGMPGGDLKDEIAETQKQLDGIVKARDEANERVEKSPAGSRPRIQAQEEELAVMQKHHDLLQRISKDYLEMGDTERAKFYKDLANRDAERMAREREEIEKNKESLKQYMELLDEMFADEGGEGPHAKHKMISAEDFDRGIYGISSYEVTQIAAAAQRDHNREIAEFERLLKQTESPMDKLVHQLENLNKLYADGSIQNYDNYLKAREQAIKDYEGEVDRVADHIEQTIADIDITPRHQDGESHRRKGGQAVEYDPRNVDPRFLRSGDDESKKQTGLQEDIRNLIREILGQGPAVVTP